ncbi:hypothetical protein C0J52_16261 [Blattella germanica]|nr:hypothetical protein C0J52_16261 [Blattella germanica]
MKMVLGVFPTLVLVMVSHHFTEACPAMCKCTRFKVFCRDTNTKSLPHGLPRTTQLLSMEGDILAQLNSSVIAQLGSVNLTRLRLTSMQIQTIEASTFRLMTMIEWLTITKNSIVDLKPRAFLGLGQLFYLDISDNRLSHLQPWVFQGLEGLRHLRAGGNRILVLHFGTLNGLRSGLKSYTTRRVLDFSRNWFTVVHKNAFRNLSSFTELQIGFAFSPLILPTNIFEGLDGLRRISVNPSGWSKLTSENTTMRGLFNLRDFQMEQYYLPKISKLFIADSSLLKRLRITGGKVEQLELGCFQGLQSLVELDLSGNKITHLNNFVFKDLVSLRILILSQNYLTTIQENAFKGLGRLLFLRLTPNKLKSLARNTFADLPFLRELTLSENQIDRVHPEAFAGLFSLKRLQVLYSPEERSSDVTLEALCRLDSFQGPSHFLAEGIQVVRSLNLTGLRGVVLKNLGKWMASVKYIRDQIHLEIYDNGVVESYPSTYSSVSSLYLSHVRVLKNNSLSAFPKLKSLTIRTRSLLKVEQGAFNKLYTLKYIKLQSYKAFHLEAGLFQGLPHLHTLVILGPNWRKADDPVFTPDVFQGLHNVTQLEVNHVRIDNVHPGFFFEFKNLQTLNVQDNHISNLSRGAFLGLDKVQNILLGPNFISSIDAGVFGALCDDNFTLTCANLTRLSKYCNTTFVLPTLRHLDFDNNEITFIHPHAFLGCSQLRNLILSWSKILILDFLYTPQLRVLSFTNGNISQISNTSFSCTSMISDISFDRTDVQDMNSAAFERLKRLKTFTFPRFPCHCNMQVIWRSFRDRRVQYSSHSTCSAQGIDSYFPHLECNSSLGQILQSTNRSSTSNDYLYFKLYIEPIVLIFIFVGGCFGNGLLMYVILRHSDMRNKNNACVLHLAIADCLSLILNVPLSYWDIVHVTWDLGDTACKVFITSKDFVVGLVVFSVLALSFERFLVVYSSFKLSLDIRSVLFLGIVWIFALVCSVPSYFSATVQTRCFSSPPERQSLVQRSWTFQLLMYCLLPVLSILILNIMTAYILKTSIGKSPGVLRNKSRDKNRNVVANTVVILSVVFIVSYVPNFALRTLVSWSILEVEEVFWYAFFTFCLFFFHTLFNPFALMTMGSKYRSHILGYISCFTKEKKLIPDAIGDDPVEMRDFEARQARQERLKRLQARFM